MKKFTKELYSKMQSTIQEISNSGVSGFDYYRTCYHEMLEISKKLKSYILNYRFADQQEEIEFFKDVKPKFQSRLMYFNELIQVEIQKPLISEKRMLAKYYRRSSAHYAALASRNQLFLHYMRSNYESGDHLLFVRSNENFDFINTDLDLDEKYSTPASTELSKLISYELVIEHLAEKVNELISVKGNDTGFKHKLVWEGPKVGLIEIGYAIHELGAVKAPVAQIMEGLQFLFNTDLGQFYRVFQDMRIRKGSRTLYLDDAIRAINKRMDETDLKLKK
ncbi:RteC domain-containing protein [uncultured Dysgonomonas sp.]|mgnify:CR=1 FL=1|uniref:RteC domain-containing protein n=1 Tax=uncultured Dysgonomonas sp. TaxID=206096 RepID=UPI000A6B94BB|nr:RteC domain-containing protein [uncultured Dysgonomonas sp.]